MMMRSALWFKKWNSLSTLNLNQLWNHLIKPPSLLILPSCQVVRHLGCGSVCWQWFGWFVWQWGWCGGSGWFCCWSAWQVLGIIIAHAKPSAISAVRIMTAYGCLANRFCLITSTCQSHRIRHLSKPLIMQQSIHLIHPSHWFIKLISMTATRWVLGWRKRWYWIFSPFCQIRPAWLWCYLLTKSQRMTLPSCLPWHAGRIDDVTKMAIIAQIIT